MSSGLRIAVAALSATLTVGLTGAGAQAAVVSQSFTTPGEQQFVVPPGVNSVQATAVGGNGGPGNEGTPGGSGATATATLAVTPGETLYAEVAGNGQGTNSNTHEEGLGGYGGGGSGGVRVILFAEAPGGGGGGGASDVRTCPASATSSECGERSSLESRLLVAAGGGGGGGVGLPFSVAAGVGGPANLPGDAGSRDTQGDEGGSGGKPGTSTASGAAGSPSFGCETPPPPEGEGCAKKGGVGLGGDGGSAQGGGGGGGGGGLFGGGGGGGGWGSATGSGASMNLYNGGGGGGGGGASGVPAGAVGVSGFSLVPPTEGAQPSVTFTWTPSAPAAITAAPSAITATTATLGGTVNPSAWQITSCAFALTPAPAGVALFPCAQQLGAGVTPLPVSATAAGLAPNTTYTATLLAMSIQGTGSGSPVTFTTLPASTSSTPASSSDAGPMVSALALSPTRFRRGTHAATLAKHSRKRTPVGTTISFTVSQAATVTLTFQRAQPGISSGARCLAPSSKRRHGRRCTRYTAVHGSVSLAASAGADHVGFDGLLADGAKLAPGSYRLQLSASDATGTTAAAQRPLFTLVG